MSMMADVVGADRVYIWKNSIKDGRLYCTQLYEWSEDVEPQQGNEFTVDIPYDERIPSWEKKLSSGYCINSLVRDMSQIEQAQLSPQGILSILVVPVFLQEKFWGFVGFDDCQRERIFTENEESILRSGSLLIANALLRNEMTLSIRDTAARLEAVISNYSGVIWCVDKNNMVTLFNGSYLNKLGIPSSSVEGRDLDLVRQENRFLDIIDEGRKTFTEGPQEWHSKIGGNVYRVHTMPIFDENGDVVSVVGSIDDITELIRLQTELESALEKAQAASRAKSNFLSNMSHEIRTPMNAIIGMTNIGKSAPDLEKKNYAFEKIEGASNHLLGIINDILEMSKIEAGKFDLSLVEFNFEKMLQKVVNVINFKVDEKKQKLSIQIDKEIPHFLIGDDQRLVQVITNLFSNAVKFTPEEGSIRLAVHLEKVENNIYTLKFEVSDTGIGISPEQQSRLFTSFEQAESSTSRKFGGTGLGLAISRHIVELMNGKMWIESELGAGATFFFTIQVSKGGEDKIDHLLPGVDWSNVRILAVDDDPDILETFIHVFEHLNLVCDTAASGEEALQLIKTSGPYNLYFIDWKMPGMNGIELSREINTKQTGNSVVIMISAVEWNAIEQEAKKAGVEDFLSKPLFPSTVANCVNKYVANVDLPKDNKTIPDQQVSYPGRCLLLAEDVDINREIVLTMLEPLKLKIECAMNGKEAVQMFNAEPDRYDLIFMDLQMPEMDGLEATRLIRAFEAEYKTKSVEFPKETPKLLSVHPQGVPIIAMTANVFREDIEKCLEAGMNDHLGKPLDFAEVLQKLKTFLKP